MTMTAPAAEQNSTWGRLVALQVGQAAALAVGAVSLAFVPRVLGPDRYGTLTLFLAVAQYSVIFTVSWTSTAIIRFGRVEFLETASVRNVFWTRLAIIAPCVAVAVTVMIAGSDRIAAAAGFPRSYVGALIAMIAALALADHVDCTLQAIGCWRRYAWLGAIEKLTFVGGIALVALGAHGLTVRAAIVAAVAAQAARIAVGAAAIWRRRVVVPVGVDGETALALVRYSWPQTFTFTIGYASAFAEPFLIKHYVTVESLGVYQVPLQISILCALVLSPLSALLLPAVTSLRVQQRHDLLAVLLGRVIPQFVFAVNLLLVCAMAGAALLFGPVFGPHYAAGLTALLLLLASVSFQVVTICYSPILAAFDLTKESATLNTVGGLVVHLVPEVVLIPAMGIDGAAASWLIWYVSSAAFCVWAIQSRRPDADYSILLIPLIGLTGAAIVLFVPGVWTRSVLLAVGVCAALAWARRRSLFQAADLPLLETLGIPAPLRRLATRAYPLLESSSPA